MSHLLTQIKISPNPQTMTWRDMDFSALTGSKLKKCLAIQRLHADRTRFESRKVCRTISNTFNKSLFFLKLFQLVKHKYLCQAILYVRGFG